MLSSATQLITKSINNSYGRGDHEKIELLPCDAWNNEMAQPARVFLE